MAGQDERGPCPTRLLPRLSSSYEDLLFCTCTLLRLPIISCSALEERVGLDLGSFDVFSFGRPWGGPVFWDGLDDPPQF